MTEQNLFDNYIKQLDRKIMKKVLLDDMGEIATSWAEMTGTSHKVVNGILKCVFSTPCHHKIPNSAEKGRI